jgi:predicted RNA methylase
MSFSDFNKNYSREFKAKDQSIQAAIDGMRMVIQQIYDDKNETASAKTEGLKVWKLLNKYSPSGSKELIKTPPTKEEVTQEKHYQIISDATAKALEAANSGKPFEVKDIIDNQGIAEVGGIKRAQELIEQGIVNAAHEIAIEYNQYQSDEDEKRILKDKYRRLISLYENQPTLGAKTSTSKINQAYSTPAPLAYVAGKLSQLEEGWATYEPTGGHGMLLIDIRVPQETYFNELDPNRVSDFKNSQLRSYDTKITQEDAATYAPVENPGYIDDPAVVDRVITNPPFGSVMDENGQSKVFQTPFGETTQIDHAIVAKALESLIPDDRAAQKKAIYANSSDPMQKNREYRGRAVLIIGGPASTITTPEGKSAYYNSGSRAKFFKYLYENYGVLDHFTVNGDLYKKQGAGWPVDVITILGTESTGIALPSEKPPRMIDTWEDLWQTTQLTDEQRIKQNRITEQEVRDNVGDFLDGLSGIAGKKRTSNGGKQAKKGTGSTTRNKRNTTSGAASETSDQGGQGGSTESSVELDGGSDRGNGNGESTGVNDQENGDSRGEGNTDAGNGTNGGKSVAGEGVGSSEELSEGEQGMKDAFGDLLSAPKPVDATGESENTSEPVDYSASIPQDKIAAFMGPVQKLLAEGITTARQLAASLYKIGGDKIKKYTNAIWNLMRAFNQGLGASVTSFSSQVLSFQPCPPSRQPSA